MTLPTEQNSIKFRGSAIDGEDFPIPFSFRHKDVLKVETINSAGVATQKVRSTDGVNNDYILVQKTTAMAGVVDDNVRTDHGWIAWVGVSPSDIIHIYKEETLLQPIDFAHVAGNPSIPAEDFELAKTRCIESFAKTLSRDDNDPLAYGAKGNRIDCAIPVRPDDALTLGTLNNINAISSLDIPASPSAPSSPEMSVWVPTSLAPSAPAVAWENRLTLPSVAGDGTQDDFLLTTTLTPLVSPFVEWAESRWIMPPPNNGLVWRVAYDRDSESAKSMAWREYRPLFAEWVGTDLHGRYMILDDATAKTSSWHKKHDTVGQIGGDPTVLKTNPPQKNRVVAAVDGTLGLSPRFDYSTVSLNIDPATDLAYDSLYVVDGTGDGTDSHHHIEFEFSLANPMKNDAGNDVAPSMIFLCVKTFSETVAPHPPQENFTAYPVFNIRHNFIEIPEEDDPTSTDGDLSSTSVITGSFMLMNRTQQYGTGWGTDAIEFYWTGDRSVTIHCLCMYDTEI